MFKEHHNAILEHAVEEAPKEALGVISGGQYIRLKNVHPDPNNHFRMSDADIVAYVLPKKIEALVHSHPSDWEVLTSEELDQGKHPRPILRKGPSQKDMQQQILMGIPWIIAFENARFGTWGIFDWGKHTLELPILGRDFIHGVEDCYELIRKYEWQTNTNFLDPYPRDDFWWDTEGEEADIYMKNFEGWGYHRITPRNPSELEFGDVFIYRLMSDTYNHGGVYGERGSVWHHPPNKLSHATPLGPMFRRIDFWVRREK